MTQSTENRQEKAIVPQDNKIKSKMDYRAKIEIDVQEAFDELRRKEQEEFIKSNLSVLDTDDLIEVIESRGYKVIEE